MTEQKIRRRFVANPLLEAIRQYREKVEDDVLLGLINPSEVCQRRLGHPLRYKDKEMMTFDDETQAAIDAEWAELEERELRPDELRLYRQTKEVSTAIYKQHGFDATTWGEIDDRGSATIERLYVECQVDAWCDDLELWESLFSKAKHHDFGVRVEGDDAWLAQSRSDDEFDRCKSEVERHACVKRGPNDGRLYRAAYLYFLVQPGWPASWAADRFKELERVAMSLERKEELA